MSRYITIKLFLLIFCTTLVAQDNKSMRDSLWMATHSAQRATLYSAVLPGLGQIYNRDYWKVPIVYAGFAAIVYFTIDNTNTYFDYRDGYYNLLNETGNESYKQLAAYPPEALGYSKQAILDIFERNRDRFRRYREMNILTFIGFYLLNVIEANISAHFLHFDVSEELAFDVNPSLQKGIYTGAGTAGITLSLKF